MEAVAGTAGRVEAGSGSEASGLDGETALLSPATSI
jgi:hypothetical protein